MALRTLKNLSLHAAHRSGALNILQRIERDDDRPLYVLAYHRVDEFGHQPLLDPDLISATPALFAAHMQMIARAYQPVSAEDVVNAVERGVSLPRGAVLVTVDDGYRDFRDVIFPIAHRYGVRPVLFVPTAFVGQGVFWWDELYRALQFAKTPQIDTPIGRLPLRTPDEKNQAMDLMRVYVKQSPFEQAHREVEALYATVASEMVADSPITLDWGELRALARDGATIAAHTHTHPILSHISLEQARREIRESQQLIAREIGHALPLFAFPDGQPQAFNADVMQILREEDFKVAVTMVEGCAYLKRDEHTCLRRLGMSPNLDPARFHLHLTAAYDQWKRRQQ
jgi:peptidoglycan/xylan/chitin deacetylase (PgdA/CDA1 family)